MGGFGEGAGAELVGVGFAELLDGEVDGAGGGGMLEVEGEVDGGTAGLRWSGAGAAASFSRP